MYVHICIQIYLSAIMVCAYSTYVATCLVAQWLVNVGLAYANEDR